MIKSYKFCFPGISLIESIHFFVELKGSEKTLGCYFLNSSKGVTDSTNLMRAASLASPLTVLCLISMCLSRKIASELRANTLNNYVK